MDEGDKITLDRDTFKALAVDTRVKILRILDDRQHTLSDLAEELGMAPSTIKEHLDTLVAAGLIRQEDKGMKWKYYKLTTKGKQIINPYEKKVWIILATMAVALMASLYALYTRLQELMIPLPYAQTLSESAEREAPSSLAAGAYNSCDTSAPLNATPAPEVMKGAAEATSSTIQQTIPHAVANAPVIPYLELIAALLFAVFLGICLGYLVKRKKSI